MGCFQADPGAIAVSGDRASVVPLAHEIAKLLGGRFIPFEDDGSHPT